MDGGRLPAGGEPRRWHRYQRALGGRELLIGKTVTLVNVELGKYAGRVVATVLLADGAYLSDMPIKAGLGRPYDGGAREGWCGEDPA